MISYIDLDPEKNPKTFSKQPSVYKGKKKAMVM